MNHFLAQEIREKEGSLPEKEARHAAQVLRLAPGALISVSDGLGKVWQAELLNQNSKKWPFRLLKEIRREKPATLSLVIAPPKSADRFEFALEKCVELGVREIIPVIAQHSERRRYKVERGQRVMEAAFKQSKKGYLPLLQELKPLKAVLQAGFAGKRYIAHLEKGNKTALHELPADEALQVFIGPEGDFSKKEIELAEDQGCSGLELGAEVLRTETAAIYAAAALALLRR